MSEPHSPTGIGKKTFRAEKTDHFEGGATTVSTRGENKSVPEKRHVVNANRGVSYDAPQWLVGNRNVPKAAHPTHCKPTATAVSSEGPEWMLVPGVPTKQITSPCRVKEGKRIGRDTNVDYNPLTFSKLAACEQSSAYNQAQERNQQLQVRRAMRGASEMVEIVRNTFMQKCKASGQSAYLHQMFRGILRLFRK